MANQPITAHHVSTPFSFDTSPDRRIVYIFTPNPHVGPTSQTLADFRASIAAANSLLREIDGEQPGLRYISGSGGTATATWLDKPARFTVVGGISHCTIESGGMRFEFCATANTLVRSIGNATRAYARHLARGSAKIVPFPKR